MTAPVEQIGPAEPKPQEGISHTGSEDLDPKIDQEIVRIMNADAAWTIFPRYRELYIEQILRLQSRIDEHKKRRSSLSSTEEGTRDKNDDMQCAELLLRYGSLLQSFNQINNLPSPDKISVKNIRQLATDNQLHDYPTLGHIMSANSRHELIAPISPPFKKDWIFRIVEKLTWRIISKPSPTYSTSTGDVPVYSDKTVLKIARFTMLIIASISLLIPIVILYFVTKGFWPVMVIILWTITFTAVIALATDARNTEVLTATAAYAAVMVVFVRS